MNFLKNIHHEITPLEPDDSFLVFDRHNTFFDYPIHYHKEFELNFIYNGKGVKRYVGDSVASISNIELVLVGPNLNHGWLSKETLDIEAHEITIQFSDKLFHEVLLSKKIMKPIKDMFQKAAHGILFSEGVSKEIYKYLVNISNFTGMNYFIEFLKILQILATSENQVLLSNYVAESITFNKSNRMETLYNFIQKNFKNKMTLEEVSSLLNMSNVSFNRFIKRRTGKTFIEFLNERRISHACMQLIETNDNIAQIAFDCGFNNIANFNRAFKKIKSITPTEFRDQFTGTKKIL